MTTLDQARTPSRAAPAEVKARRPGLRRAGGNLVRILLVGFFAFPLVFMFMSSLKPDDQIFADFESVKAFLPVGDISLDNYTGVFDTVPAARYLANSIGSYFQSIPTTLDEAARVDGAGWFRIYRSVVMPLAGPAIRDRGHPELPAGLELVPVAADGGPDREPPAGHGRGLLLPAAAGPVGPDHGLPGPDHHPGAGVVPGPPAPVHPQHRLGRGEGMSDAPAR
jgi:hypothetical protein